MKISRIVKALVVLGGAVLGTGTAAEVRYVWRDNPAPPLPPYTGGWAAAATNLQDAIDAAVAGDLILVTNGLYDLGGRVAPGDTVLKTRVVIDKAVTVASVNGPEVTTIAGAAHPDPANGGLGDGALRGVYLASGATLAGFSVTNGFTRAGTSLANASYGGGIRAESVESVISNCVVRANGAAMRGGGVHLGTLLDCTVAGNTVRASSSSAGGGGAFGARVRGGRIERNQTLGANTDGGGAYQGTLEGCRVEANTAGRDGGGVYEATSVSNCLVVANVAGRNGGGVYSSPAYDSELRANRARGTSATTGLGGGFYAASTSFEAHRCRLLDNEANYRGGGAYQGRLYSCVIGGNRARQGGGFYGSGTHWLNSCTVMGNTAAEEYGGTYGGTIRNSILFDNSAPSRPNWGSGTITYTCADPLPAGAGNTNVAPRVSGHADPHLLPGSPCVGIGLVEAWMTGATDLDGEPRVRDNQVDLGADQFHAPDLAGELAVQIVTPTNFCAVAFPHPFRAEVTGRVAGLTWVFGDGTGATNANPVSHAFMLPGAYTVTVTATNRTHQAQASLTISALDYVLFVSPQGGHEPPFDTWAKAATNIQDAVDAVALPGGVVLVTNGVYAVGSRTAAGQTLPNRVLLDRPVRLRSVHGPAATRIEGAWHDAAQPLGTNAVRGAYVGGSAELEGFTISSGATRAEATDNGRGGGVFVEQGGRVTDCVMSGNRAWSGAGAAGAEGKPGEVRGTTLVGNVALPAGFTRSRGGGASDLVLEDCRLEANEGYDGGGAYVCELVDCHLSGNTATLGGGARNSNLRGCDVRNNSASSGGGVYEATLERCRLLNNVASGNGGGAYDAKLVTCVAAGNRAQRGGGFYAGTAGPGLFSSTVVDNSASIAGGGLSSSIAVVVRNSILFHNTAPANPNYTTSALIDHSCATPLPAGAGNLDVDPLLAGFERPYLLPHSPCRGAGTVEPWMAGALDFEGEPRLDASWVDIGADQVHGPPHGTLAVTILAPEPPYFPDAAYTFRAVIDGQPAALLWDFGDGTSLADQAAAAHQWAEGLYTLRLTVSNSTATAEATLAIAVAPDTRYVAPAGSHTPPYQTWATAARDIQTAVDAVRAGGRVLVAAGVYDSGGRTSGTELLTNRVLVDKPIILLAVDGPERTWIVGAPSADPPHEGLGEGAVRGVRLAAGALLGGFTITNGWTRWNESGIDGDFVGGGVFATDASSVVSNCVIVANHSACRGGGVFRGTVFDSTMAENRTATPNTRYGDGGGAYGLALASNCVVRANHATGSGGGLFGGRVVGSILEGNTAGESGGGYGSDTSGDELRDCVIEGNSAVLNGGGVLRARVYDSLLTNNRATLGGGYYMPGGITPGGRLYRCRLLQNKATSGGGAYEGSLFSCVLAGNEAGNAGGGALGSTLENCTVVGNSARAGGGVSGVTAYFSVIYDNTAAADANFRGGSLYGCCSVPFVENVTFDLVTDPPQLTGLLDPHLLPGSPCLDRGGSRPWMVGEENLDLDRQARKTGRAPDLGADEFHADALDGPLTLTLRSDQAVIGPGYAPEFRAEIQGLPASLIWDFGDGTSATNRNPVRHAFRAAGAYTIRATVANTSHNATAQLSLTVDASDTYVALNGGHVPPFTTWATAATNIQAAVDAARWGGTVWIANGIYRAGGRPAVGGALTNRVTVEKALTLSGTGAAADVVITGAWHTQDQPCGSNAVRGVYLGHPGARLRQMTVAGGASGVTDDADDGGGVWAHAEAEIGGCVVSDCRADDEGGGVYGGRLSDTRVVTNHAGWGGGGLSQSFATNCVLTHNRADSDGGGAVSSSLVDCLVLDNAAEWSGGGLAGGDALRCRVERNACLRDGGGAADSVLISCWLFANTADHGAGASDSELNNCTVVANRATVAAGGVDNCAVVNGIVWDNQAPAQPNWSGGTFWHSTTQPLPDGVASLGYNLDTDPMFVDAAAGNGHLRAGSPCIDSGVDEWWVAETDARDLAGQPRRLGSRVDRGAYENDATPGTAALGTPITWLEGHGLGPDWDAAELADPDGDGALTWQEYVALTDPRERASVLRIRDIRSAPGGFELAFETVTGRSYQVQRASSPAAGNWQPATGWSAGSGALLTIPVAAGAGGGDFYRLQVKVP